MMSRIAAALAGGLALTIPAHAQKPALADLLRLGADYHASYAARVSGASLEERYALIQVIGGRMNPPVYFSSDVLFLNLNGRIIGMRDPFAVDNVPLRQRTPRIRMLLAEPT